MKNSVNQGDEKIRGNSCLEPMPHSVPQKCLEEEKSTLIIVSERCMIEMQFCLKQRNGTQIRHHRNTKSKHGIVRGNRHYRFNSNYTGH